MIAIILHTLAWLGVLFFAVIAAVMAYIAIRLLRWSRKGDNGG